MRNFKYNTDDNTRQEFENFLSWYIYNRSNYDNNKSTIPNIVEDYFKSQDIALYGIKKLNGAYTRNAKKELFLIIGIPIISIIIALFIINLI